MSKKLPKYILKIKECMEKRGRNFNDCLRVGGYIITREEYDKKIAESKRRKNH